MQIEIPGYQTLTINHLLLDYNGTIAEDGRIRDRVRELLIQLSESLTIHVLTADTHGTAAAECQSIPFFWTPSQRLMLLPINFRNSKKPERPAVPVSGTDAMTFSC